MTKKYKKLYIFWQTLSILCLIAPLIIYSIIGFTQGTIGQHFTLGICLITALIFVFINLLFKKAIRSTIWIFLVGIHVCIENILPLLIIMLCTTLIDEFVCVPLCKYYKNKCSINKEIDKRGLNG